jgi:hypothetical protein
MTAHDHSRDELVSAYLDGEATAEEQARIEADPELQARVAEFAATSDAVRADVPTVSDATRDAVLARVLGTVIAPTNVVPLRRRRPAPATVLGVAAAAIAVAFLGGAIALLANDGRGDDDTASTGSGAIAMSESDDAASNTTAASGEDRAGDGAGDSADDSGGAAPSPAEGIPIDDLGYLGAFDDDDALRERVELFALGAIDTTGTEANPELQATVLPPACEAGAAIVYRADLDGQSVLVFVGAETVTVLATADCSIVTSFPR